ncbi:flagellar biosynthesis anti-sigma factor FlgM [Acidithiobacillus sp.]|jgi:negative regulator of flagellin synthesis FlgM|uniref:flagellar biosynthesis anti-sigma factor FlgM n=1 Tax=Acidithiobacillus sp. TaxID=1872118 RepID=UPI0026073C71|nr:flagellar biosynthesis anti-sigma factor FlgM [Acidithiobacillus sp.]
MNPINPYSGVPGTKTQTSNDAAITASQPASSGASPAQSAKNPTIAQDHVTLSPVALSLLATHNSTSKDSGRVQSIKSALANGTYQISPQRIGQGLTQDAQQFLPLVPGNKA